METSILKQVEKFASDLLSRIPANYHFHNLSHTHMVVEAANEICNEIRADDETREVVLIAAWFHDTGYIKEYIGHEEESKNIAMEFLLKKQYSIRKINKVLNAINATRINYTAQCTEEKILRDADAFHLACNHYFSILKRLRMEWESTFQSNFTDQDFYRRNYEFLRKHKFCTKYGKRKWEMKKQKNIKANLQHLNSIS